MTKKITAIFGIVAAISGAVTWHYLEFAPRPAFEALAEDVKQAELKRQKREWQSQVWFLQDALRRSQSTESRKEIQRQLRGAEAELEDIKAEIKRGRE